MAHPRIIAQRSAEAQQRLVDSASRAAEALGIEPPAIPFRHKNPEQLPALQANAISDFLDDLASRATRARVQAAAMRSAAIEAGVAPEELDAAEQEAVAGTPAEPEPDPDSAVSTDGTTSEPADGVDAPAVPLGVDGEPVDLVLEPEDPSKCKDGEATEDCAKRQADNRRRREARAAAKSKG